MYQVSFVFFFFRSFILFEHSRCGAEEEYCLTKCTGTLTPLSATTADATYPINVADLSAASFTPTATDAAIPLPTSVVPQTLMASDPIITAPSITDVPVEVLKL